MRYLRAARLRWSSSTAQRGNSPSTGVESGRETSAAPVLFADPRRRSLRSIGKAR
jgi:hypothetical protein